MIFIGMVFSVAFEDERVILWRHCRLPRVTKYLFEHIPLLKLGLELSSWKCCLWLVPMIEEYNNIKELPSLVDVHDAQQWHDVLILLHQHSQRAGKNLYIQRIHCDGYDEEWKCRITCVLERIPPI